MMRVLITAAPKNVIDQYVAVADELGLNLQAIELESIALTRSSVEDTTKTTLLLDIGARSTDVTLVDHGAVQLSHNVDAAGEGLTKMVVNSKEETFLEAERTKRAKPFADEKGRIRKEFEGVAKQIVREAQRAAEEYQEQTGRPIQNIVLAGGTVILDGVDRFFQAMFPNTTVIKGNPWKGIATPDVLTPVLNDMAPAYGVAVGLALRPLKQRKPVNMREENPAPAATASSISSSSDSASEAARKSVQALSQ